MNDLISRQAAIDTALEFIVEYLGGAFDEDFQKELSKRMLELPSVEPEQKKGKWIELTNTNHTYICSVCGRMLVNIPDGKNKVTKNYPFCHCGADMRGGNNAAN